MATNNEENNDTTTTTTTTSTTTTSVVPLILCKLWWFFFGSVAIIYLTFQYPFLTHIGLTARQVGIISAISAIFAAPTAPLWGALADRTGWRRCIMMLLCTAFMCIMLAVPWVAVRFTQNGRICVHADNIGIQNSSTRGNISSQTLTFSTFSTEKVSNSSLGSIGLNTTFKGNSSLKNLCEQMEGEGSSESLFYWMLFLWLSSSCCLLPTYGLFQSITMNVVENTCANQGCGDHMMYMPVGAGLFSLLAGLFADSFRHPEWLSGYTAVYLLLPPLTMPLLPATFFVFRYTNWERATETQPLQCDVDEENDKIPINSEPTIRSARCTALKEILTNPKTGILLVTVLVFGVLTAFINSFLFLLMEDEMAASTTSMGTTGLVQCLSATIIYYLTERTIQLFGGIVPSIEISLASYAVRLMATSFINDSWLVSNFYHKGMSKFQKFKR